MKSLNYFLLLLFTAQVHGVNTQPDLMLQCRERDFLLPDVEFIASSPPKVKEFSVSFMDSKDYWSILAYEFDKQEKLYLFKGIQEITPSKNIAKTVFGNFKYRLENEMFYTTTPVESFPVSISGNVGEAYILDAAFGASEKELADIAVNERFALWVISKGGKIFFGKLHIIIEETAPSIKLTKERLAKFMRTCSVISV